MAKAGPPSQLLLRYPSPPPGEEQKIREFRKIRPEIEKMYDGDHADLFLRFSEIVYRSFTEPFLEGRSVEQHYRQLRYFFDFFMKDFESDAVGGVQLPGHLIHVEQPPNNILPDSNHRIGCTGILGHVTDSPFILENIGGYLNLTEHHVIAGISPVMCVKRKGGKIVDIQPSIEGNHLEVFIYTYIAKVVNPTTIAKLKKELDATLKSLLIAITDFRSMAGKSTELCDELEQDKIDPEDGRETAEFIKWLIPKNFIFMGMTSFDIKKEKNDITAKERTGEEMGVFRDVKLMETVFPGFRDEIEKRVIQSYERYYMLVLDFLTTSPNIIYHREAVDVAFVRQLDKNKKAYRVTVLMGRFSRGALLSKSADLPFLRKKFQRILESEKIRHESHLYREIYSIFNNLPKKVLFYIDRVSLPAVLNISARLNSEDELHLLFRHSTRFEYMAAIVLFSAKKLSEENIGKIIRVLEDMLGVKSVYHLASRSLVVAQVFVYFPIKAENGFDINIAKAADRMNLLITSWDSLLKQKLVARLGDRKAFTLYNRYLSRFTDLYKNAVAPEEAVADLCMLDELEKTGAIQLDIIRKRPDMAVLRIYWGHELNLMKLIPTFSNLGITVKEEIALPLINKTNKNRPLFIQLLHIEGTSDEIQSLFEVKEKLIEAIQLVIDGKAEDARLNRLIIKAGFNWKQVDLVRAFKNYMVQINMLINPASVATTLNNYPEITSLGVRYFEQKFNTAGSDSAEYEKTKNLFFKKLEAVADLNEDSILRLFFNVIENTLRTNYFKPKGYHYLSFKINCKGVIQMPKPVPMAEIFVHSPFLDGVHLRGGKVARGGLRWSDRTDDFRTEILGLMKTQMVKNSVIVPVGSKGGFILKKFKFKTPEERAALFKHHYQTFIRGLLDLTDNLAKGEHAAPEGVVCHDGPDPYLVVAADKGTAAMSDAANEVSEEYDFWLKDAFASGGSQGYDHKEFGITAKGAWECIKRHFREIGIDIQKESVTVAGVGGMAGDVFGNGMLLSKKIKLVAAFDHLNIFMDPSPDPEKSFKERRRLFNTPGCHWSDYNPALISRGGGVYSRRAKSIPISPEMREKLGINDESISGEKLIRAILAMPVGLLYFGGIGTYIRSSDETNADVGDKANDTVRITAKELKTRVIGEGANLAMTHRARIEYAENGGRLNTDSVDNSAGVDISDHEVNIKIFLEVLLAKKELKNRKERNHFFAKLGPDVVEMVLADNYYQSAGISLDQKASNKKLELYLNYIEDMEAAELFNREVEDIPESEKLLSYAEKPGCLPRPILCLLFGYEKMRLSGAVLESPIVDTAFARRYFISYFPPVIRHDHEAHLDEHRLKKEIIATTISNRIVNQAGITFVYNMEKATGAATWEIVRAYLIAENLLEADNFRKMVHELDNRADANLQTDMLLHMEDIIGKVVLWMLTHFASDRISFDFVNQYQQTIARFQADLFGKLESICSMEEGCVVEKVKEYEKQNIPPDLGSWLVILPYLKDVMAILAIKEARHAEFVETGNLFVLVTSYFEIDWINSLLEKYAPTSVWEKIMRENLYRELETHQSNIVMKVLEFKRKDETMEQAFTNYMREKEALEKEYRRTIANIKEEKSHNLMAVSVLINRLEVFI